MFYRVSLFVDGQGPVTIPVPQGETVRIFGAGKGLLDIVVSVFRHGAEISEPIRDDTVLRERDTVHVNCIHEDDLEA